MFAVEQSVGLVQGAAQLLAKLLDALGGRRTGFSPDAVLWRLRQLQGLTGLPVTCKLLASGAGERPQFDAVVFCVLDQAGGDQSIDLGTQLDGRRGTRNEPQVFGDISAAYAVHAVSGVVLRPLDRGEHQRV